MSFQPGLLAVAAAICLLSTACAPAESKSASSRADETIGVIQCDEYLSKAAICINERAPEARRAALLQDVRSSRTMWKEAATPSERAALPQACTIAHEQAKEEYAAFGCTM